MVKTVGETKATRKIRNQRRKRRHQTEIGKRQTRRFHADDDFENGQRRKPDAEHAQHGADHSAARSGHRFGRLPIESARSHIARRVARGRKARRLREAIGRVGRRRESGSERGLSQNEADVAVVDARLEYFEEV